MLLQLSNRIPGLPDIDCGVADYLETCNLLKIVGGTDSCASQFPWLVRASALSCCPNTIVNYNAKGVSVVIFLVLPIFALTPCLPMWMAQLGFFLSFFFLHFGNTRSRQLLCLVPFFTFHLRPEREKNHCNSTQLCRRRESNPGCQHSN